MSRDQQRPASADRRGLGQGGRQDRPAAGRPPAAGDEDRARQQTPSALGYLMPAEWHPHQATWLSYPSNKNTFPDLEQVRNTYREMTTALLPNEQVHLLIDEPGMEEQVRSSLPSDAPQGNLICHVLPTTDVWIRDYGPNFLVRRDRRRPEQGGDPAGGTGEETDADSRRPAPDRDAAPRPAEADARSRPSQWACNDWIFNAWGGKYDDLLPDDSVPGRLQSVLPMRRFEPGIVLEGGSIEVDGQGTCLTSEQCLLNPNRNPRLDRRGLEGYLREYLGTGRVLWLGEGIVGDDTDGHIDDIARFASPDTIICALEHDPRDENFTLLEDNLKRLKHFRRTDGEPYRIVTLPMPHALHEEDGTRLPASYANFYIANRVVLVPTFRDARDSVALQTLQELFPDRRVLGIDCRQLVRGLGALHCVTQQQPKALSPAGGPSPRRPPCRN